MPISKSPLAYEDVTEAMNRALESERGIRIKFNVKGHAINFVQRANYRRKLARRESAEMYAKDHPMHGKTEFDRLALVLQGTDVLMRPRSIDDYVIEDL